MDNVSTLNKPPNQNMEPTTAAEENPTRRQRAEKVSWLKHELAHGTQIEAGNELKCRGGNAAGRVDEVPGGTLCTIDEWIHRHRNTEPGNQGSQGTKRIGTGTANSGRKMEPDIKREVQRMKAMLFTAEPRHPYSQRVP
jgi:hypothetical protein